MFIDIHTHAYRDPGPPRNGKQRFCRAEQLIARFDELDIERGVVLPIVSPEVNLPQSSGEIMEMAEQYGDRIIPFCNIDPRAGSNAADADLGALLRYYKDKGAKGCGEITANLPFLHPMVRNLFKHLEELEMPLTFHIAPQIGGLYGLYDEPGLPQLEWSLATFPKLKFFAHSQGFWSEMGTLEKTGDRYGYPQYPIHAEGAAPKLMRQHPNLYGDLSAGSGYNALSRDPDYAVKFLNEFQDRLFFGTDICAPDTKTPLVGFLLELRDSGKISEEVFQKVARENAIRVLDLA